MVKSCSFPQAGTDALISNFYLHLGAIITAFTRNIIKQIFCGDFSEFFGWNH